MEGRRIREVAAELFRQWLDEDQASGGASANDIPLVRPAQLHRHADATSLRRAYPRGYRLTGPLLPASKNAPVIPPAVVEQALEDMETEELTANDRPR